MRFHLLDPPAAEDPPRLEIVLNTIFHHRRNPLPTTKTHTRREVPGTVLTQVPLNHCMKNYTNTESGEVALSVGFLAVGEHSRLWNAMNGKQSPVHSEVCL